MTSIYLIRHAEAEGNLYRIAQGQDNSILTERGWRQVNALEQRFADIPIHAVYASDLYRTCATASAIYKPKQLPLHRVPELREICVGCWERRTWGDIYRSDAQQMEYFSLRPDLWQVEGGEPPAKVLERVRRAIDAIAEKHEGETVAVFSHGYAIRLLLASLQGYSLQELGNTPTGDNTAVSLLEAHHGELRVIFRDDNSHLQTPAFLAGDKARKRANALEPGLWFAPAQPDVLRPFLEEIREQGATSIPPEEGVSISLIGYLEETPVGLLQLGQERGRIALAYVRPDWRKQGYGIQLIGQAVMQTRQQGGDALGVCLSPEHPAWEFFTDCGFLPTEQGDLLKKDIRFLPEFLGDSL